MGDRQVSTGTLAAVDRALDARGELVLRLQAEDTDAYRIFHGVAEGVPGLTIDRYGPLVLVQTFRAPLDEPAAAGLERHLRSRLAHDFELVYNHRAKKHDEPFDLWHRPRESALATFECRERGVRYAVRARHRGLDPWLFLDLRAGRRKLAELAPGKSVVNHFAYTCSAGVAAACARASECWNVDFAASSLDVGRENARRNDVLERTRFVEEDFFPVARQLAGMPVKGRASRRPFARFEPRRFDVAFLDPPAWSKGPFGAVDVVGDYASLFKPALLATSDGGVVLATNHAAETDRETWRRSLERTAEKAGRPLRSIELVDPEPDFPAFDGRPPLKIACCRT
jgi:23S rRNA (cytosine1962-C5)-methyltransferase